MKLDLNSMSSQSLSSGYAVAMKKMARRRGMMNHGRGTQKKSSESGIYVLAFNLLDFRAIFSHKLWFNICHYQIQV